MTEEFKEFQKLMQHWANETGGYSTSIHVKQNDNYHKILTMTKDNVIGYAALLLNKHLHLSLLLLWDLVPKKQYPPIDRYYAGRMAVIRECWKYWALEKKIIFTKGDMTGYWEEDKYGNRIPPKIQ